MTNWRNYVNLNASWQEKPTYRSRVFRHRTPRQRKARSPRPYMNRHGNHRSACHIRCALPVRHKHQLRSRGRRGARTRVLSSHSSCQPHSRTRGHQQSRHLFSSEQQIHELKLTIQPHNNIYIYMVRKKYQLLRATMKSTAVLIVKKSCSLYLSR